MKITIKKVAINKERSKYYIPPDVLAKYGQWTVIDGNITKENDYNHYWLVRCACGTEGVRYANRIVNSKTGMCSACYLKKIKENKKKPKISAAKMKDEIIAKQRKEIDVLKSTIEWLRKKHNY